MAPYQIALHDGRLIFAPQDTDQVIRLRPPAAPDAPSSPEYVPREDGDDDGEFLHCCVCLLVLFLVGVQKMYKYNKVIVGMLSVG